jgi:aminopeptidase 2
MRSAVYSIAAENGGLREWDSFRSLYEKAAMQEEKRRLGSALFAFRNPKLIAKSIAFAFSDSVRPQDFPFMIQSGMENNDAKILIWQEIQSSWEELCLKIPKGPLLSSVIGSLGNLNAKSDLIQLDKFFRSNFHKGSEQTLSRAKEKIRINISWKENDSKIIAKYAKRGY